MEESCCLPPRAQASRLIHAPSIEFLLRRGISRLYIHELACDPNVWRLQTPIAFLRLLFNIACPSAAPTNG